MFHVLNCFGARFQQRTGWYKKCFSTYNLYFHKFQICVSKYISRAVLCSLHFKRLLQNFYKFSIYQVFPYCTGHFQLFSRPIVPRSVDHYLQLDWWFYVNVTLSFYCVPLHDFTAATFLESRAIYFLRSVGLRSGFSTLGLI